MPNRNSISNNRLEKKAMILLEYKVKPTQKALKIMEDLWDKNGVFHEEKIKDVVRKIKSLNEEFEFLKRKIMNEVGNEVRELGLKDEDFEVYDAEFFRDRGPEEKSILIIFRFKGNKRVVDYLSSKGWKIDCKYKNENGSPSIWDTNFHGKNRMFKFVMVVMSYGLDSMV